LDGFHIHHTTIDRTNGAANKFNLILASSIGLSNNATGIIEYCTFINDANIAWAVHIEMGNGIITRYNTFKGNTMGLRIAGAYTSNNQIYNNVFIIVLMGSGSDIHILPLVLQQELKYSTMCFIMFHNIILLLTKVM
jgi:hypothetical protein